MKPHNTKEYLKMRYTVVWLYNSKCFFCNTFSLSIHVHHLDHNNLNNKLNNLVPLCAQCHIMAHKIQKRNPLKSSFLFHLITLQADKYR